MIFELKFSEEDVKATFENCRKVLAERLTSRTDNGGRVVSLDFYVQPLQALALDLGISCSSATYPDPVVELLRRMLGKDYEEFNSAVGEAKSAALRLVDFVIDTREGGIEKPVREHFAHLSVFARFYNLLGGLNVPGLQEEDLKQLSSGKDALRQILVLVNRFYNPDTRAEFLENLNGGSVNKEYVSRLRLLDGEVR